MPSARPLLSAALPFLLAGGCSQPADQPSAGEARTPPAALPAPEPQTGELLIASPPDGWIETGALQTPVLKMAEYGPPDEPADTVERLTFEAQSSKPLPDPIEFVLGVSLDLKSRCKGYQDINVSSGLENGYPTSVRLMICPEFRDSPHGQVVLAKAIRGNEQFYSITRRIRTPAVPTAAAQADSDPAERRQPLSAQAMAAWSTHMKSVQVCDTRSSDHPCPTDPISVRAVSRGQSAEPAP